MNKYQTLDALKGRRRGQFEGLNYLAKFNENAIWRILEVDPSRKDDIEYQHRLFKHLNPNVEDVKYLIKKHGIQYDLATQGMSEKAKLDYLKNKIKNLRS